MREGVAQTEGRLAHERQQLADAERRGRLASGIQDEETVAVAGRFAAKHRERVAVLERKLSAQQSELMLADREYADMKAQLQDFLRSRPAADASRRVESAWRDLEGAHGGSGADREDAQLKSRLDRAAREARAEAQLDELKKRMGKR